MKEGVGRALRRAIGRDDVLSRIKPREGGISILMNERRREIYQHLAENPLTHLRSLARELDTPVGTADWHLKVLADAGVISAFEERNKRFFYPSGWIEKDDLHCLSRLQDETTKAIYFLAKKKPGMSQTDIANELGKYQQYVQPRISGLEECGFLASREKGRQKVYKVGEKVSELEEKYAGKSKSYLDQVLQMLRMDGLNPKIHGRSKVLMRVKMDDGQNFFFIKIRANPVKAILKK
ncbi:MAG: winged helix-turn-helix transcriptional regulator [Thermoplasmata archaeon]|nr:winged helix-turn-helix transcriptional regulator [Thermoplasmata archaeon]